MTCEIALSRGLVALVDDDDLALVSSVGKWYANPCARTFYARKNYWRNGRCYSIRMHSLLTGWPFVDHRNGNGLDNRRANLRPADASQNAMNRARRSDNKSGFKGVSWHRAARAWVAKIQNRHIGIYQSPIEAALAYDAAAIDLFGEFARLNFPREDMP